MPIKMRLWSIDGSELQTVASQPLDAEDRLEEWLARDVSMVSDDLLIIGRQVESGLGGVLDLLAIDGNGDLAVLELKRDRTPRDVVAQALHYAAWVRTLSWDEIDQLATEYHGGTPLASKFQEHFGRPVPDTVNGSHRIYIVAAEMDAVSEAIVRYLSEEYSVEINVVFFRYFREPDGGEYLGHSWLMEPSEVEDRGESRARKRRHHPTLEEFEALADERGVGEQYRALSTFFAEHATAVRCTQSNVAFCFDAEGAVNALLSVYPGRSSEVDGLRTDVRPGQLANVFGVMQESVRAALPGDPEDGVRVYGEVYHFRSVEEVDTLTSALSSDDAGNPSPS